MRAINKEPARPRKQRLGLGSVGAISRRGRIDRRSNPRLGIEELFHRGATENDDRKDAEGRAEGKESALKGGDDQAEGVAFALGEGASGVKN